MNENEEVWFVALIEAMDNAFLSFRAEKASSPDGTISVKMDDVAGIKRLLKSKAKAQ